MEDELSLRDERELNKIGLETYFLDKENMYDPAIDKLIEQLKNQIDTLQDEARVSQKVEKNNLKRYDEFADAGDDWDAEPDMSHIDNLLDLLYYQEQLLTLVEMKIIYAFKFLEINIKKLLRGAFSLKSTKDFYRWDTLVKFLEDRNVDIKRLNSYHDAVQLKKVNNAIKHTDDYDLSLRDIPEFNTSEKLTYSKLENFYTRVKDVPSLFLQELISAIYEELYEFDDKKITDMATSIVLRMGKEDAAKLVEKISREYK